MGKYVKLLVVLGLVCAAMPASAQVTPKLEIAGAYSYVRSNLVSADGCCFSMQGGTGSVAYNVSRSIGLVGEVGGYRSSNAKDTGLNLRVYSYVFGPRYSFRKHERVTPFVHLLLGGGHAGGSLYNGTSSTPGLGSHNAFTMVTGGGIDVNLNRHVALRVLQADYFFSKFRNNTNDHQNNLRLSFGVVFRLGEKQ
jgi:hypothetical protein